MGGFSTVEASGTDKLGAASAGFLSTNIVGAGADSSGARDGIAGFHEEEGARSRAEAGGFHEEEGARSRAGLGAEASGTETDSGAAGLGIAAGSGAAVGAAFRLEARSGGAASLT